MPDCAFTHTHLLAFTHTHLLAFTHTHLLAFTHTHLLAFTHTHIYLHSHTHIYLHSHTHIYLHSHTHIYLHSHTHLLAFTHTHLLVYFVLLLISSPKYCQISFQMLRNMCVWGGGLKEGFSFSWLYVGCMLEEKVTCFMSTVMSLQRSFCYFLFVCLTCAV